tara:strand:+ start:663 stop:815 length:153 start_codon:yes stop_codon:yes gene_type:complete
MRKKGAFSWEQISKILLWILLLVLVIVIIGLFRGKITNLFGNIAQILRFG